MRKIKEIRASSSRRNSVTADAAATERPKGAAATTFNALVQNGLSCADAG